MNMIREPNVNDLAMSVKKVISNSALLDIASKQVEEIIESQENIFSVST